MTSDFRVKLRRADEHLNAVNRHIGHFLDSRPYSVVSERDPDAAPNELRQFLKVRIRREPLPRWSAVAGDCIHNLRSCLDTLAYALAGTKAGSHTEFPIFLQQAKFEKLASTGLPKKGSGLAKMIGIPTGAQNIIKELQPYKRPHGLPARSEPLWLLQCLDIEDKHHRPLIAGGASIRSKVVIRAQSPGTDSIRFRWSQSSGVFFRKDGDVVGWYPGSSGPPTAESVGLYPDEDPQVSFDVAFDPKGPGIGMPLRKGLIDLRNAVEEAVLKLEPFL